MGTLVDQHLGSSEGTAITFTPKKLVFRKLRCSPRDLNHANSNRNEARLENLVTNYLLYNGVL